MRILAAMLQVEVNPVQMRLLYFHPAVLMNSKLDYFGERQKSEQSTRARARPENTRRREGSTALFWALTARRVSSDSRVCSCVLLARLSLAEMKDY